jgi:hypothetical protein
MGSNLTPKDVATIPRKICVIAGILQGRMRQYEPFCAGENEEEGHKRDTLTACMSTPASRQSFSDVDREFFVRRMVQASFYERGTRGPSIEFYHSGKLGATGRKRVEML